MRELDSEELSAILEEARPALARTLARYRIPPLDGEDLVQDALLLLLAKWRDVEHPAHWLIATVRLICLDHLKRTGRRRTTAVDPRLLEQLAGAAPNRQAHRDRCRDLGQLMRALPPRQRHLLRLAFGLGLDMHELAERLGGKPDSQVRARQRAVDRLRELAQAKGRG
jgi:RNA polymerase sigma-70 factor (ECF subfamily)